ncbi:PREDICTED: uncharacterized protein LOC102817025 [Chrysochloris asiatica]|uniref:Interleukin-11 n=1 Tax=Chrysochloris asiatica TaxID=185453 RepID=A0A9B0WTL5_CHRAS|nr:PREDICTED: uncharacterized protein LOC102817025 [Chrysochloris asiatica]
MSDGDSERRPRRDGKMETRIRDVETPRDPRKRDMRTHKQGQTERGGQTDSGEEGPELGREAGGDQKAGWRCDKEPATGDADWLTFGWWAGREGGLGGGPARPPSPVGRSSSPPCSKLLGLSAQVRSGSPSVTAGWLSGGTGRRSMPVSREGTGGICVSVPVSGSFPCPQVQLGLLGPGEGTGSGLCLPPHAPPRGPDSGVWGRTGDARPVYPPRAASAPTGGAARAERVREARPAWDLPRALHPGTQALILPPQIREPWGSALPPSDPGFGALSPFSFGLRSVCRLVLVVLSLWPDYVFAPGPPPGPQRTSPDPRAELDSAVLLTRALLADTRQLVAQLKDKFPADGDHSLDSLPTLAMSAGALGALQLPGVLTRLRTDLLSYLRHVQWLRRAGGPSLRTLEPELGALQARLDRLLRRLQLLMSRLALPQASPAPPLPPLAPPASAWGGIRAAHAILGGLHLTLDWAVRGLLVLRTRL